MKLPMKDGEIDWVSVDAAYWDDTTSVDDMIDIYKTIYQQGLITGRKDMQEERCDICEAAWSGDKLQKKSGR